jgi:hypothetical protein
MPEGISGGSAAAVAKPKLINGIIENWPTKPINALFGILLICTKSFMFMDVPMPNMMTINKGTISSLYWKLPNPVNRAG